MAVGAEFCSITEIYDFEKILAICIPEYFSGFNISEWIVSNNLICAPVKGIRSHFSVASSTVYFIVNLVINHIYLNWISFKNNIQEAESCANYFWTICILINEHEFTWELTTVKLRRDTGVSRVWNCFIFSQFKTSANYYWRIRSRRLCGLFGRLQSSKCL